MEKVHVLLVQNDGEKKSYDSFFVNTNNPYSALPQLKNAVRDYCDIQRSVGEYVYSDFNWGDAIREMPKEAWESHGIEKAPISSVFEKNGLQKLTLNVDKREVLLSPALQKELIERENRIGNLVKKAVLSYTMSKEDSDKLLKRILETMKKADNDKGKIWTPPTQDSADKASIKIDKSDGLSR